MQRRFWSVLWLCVLLLMSAVQSSAETFAVAPFKVNGPEGYAYLGKALPPMIGSRLYTAGKLEQSPAQDALANLKAPAAKVEAQKALAASKADYLAYGSVNIMGSEASLDLSILDVKGSVWQGSAQGPAADLLGAIGEVTNRAKSELFGIAPAGVGTGPRQMNSEFVVNERIGAAGTYLNPALRYQGTDTDRTRSQSLDYTSRGMEVADIDNDGSEEVVLFSEYDIYAYRWINGKLEQFASYSLDNTTKPLAVRHISMGSASYLIVPAWDMSSKTASSLILTVKDDAFVPVQKGIPYFINVLYNGPEMVPMLVGQDPDRVRGVRGAVFEVGVQNGKAQRLSKLQNLPKEANVFNFTYVQGGKNGGDLLVVIGPEEYLLTHNSSGTRLAKSDEKYAGTAVGLPITRDFPGLGTSSEDSGMFYYIPSRLVTADLDRDGQTELILVHPVSMGASLLENYRTFPQGEVQALVWDGVGMDIMWKTRRIKGSVADVALGDPNGDGVLDLVVNINTYPGTMGIGKVRTLISLYPLDTNKVNPGSARIFD